MCLKKRRIQKEIDACKEEIAEIEKKLSRSQSACLKALLTSSAPTDEDVKFHTMYLEQIRGLRERIRKLNEELEGKK